MEMKHGMHKTPDTEHGTHVSHHEMMRDEFKRKFIISFILSIPLVLLSPTIQQWTFQYAGVALPAFAGVKYVLFILASIIILYCSLPFYRGAINELRRRNLGMMVLVTLALGSGYLFSLGATFFFEAPDFYWEISTLAVFLLFGHWMQMRSMVSAGGALRELVKLIPPTANMVMESGMVHEVQTSMLKKGDVVLVRPGERIPIDGQVIEGEGSVNESMISGESKPVQKMKESGVIGGTLNNEGALRVRVTKTGDETALSQIIALVRKAQESKPPVQRLADRAANYLTIIAVVFGLGSFLYWNYIAGIAFVSALTIMITVIVIACPHALGLAIPVVTTISTSMAAGSGMLVRDAGALEDSEKLDMVIFDKTGTLTKGRFGVSDVLCLGSMKEKKLLSIAASLEQNSEHVIAKAIVRKAKEKKAALAKVGAFSAIPGRGVRGKAGRAIYYIGNSALMSSIGLDAESPMAKKLASEGKTVVFIASQKRIEGLITLSDIIRNESYKAISSLKKEGIKVAMLTGDNGDAASYVASELGLDKYFAEVLPGQKAESIKKLQEKGMKVAMVGDGVNDAPALVQSDVGIAIGAGTDVAIESAKMVLVRNDPRDVARLLRLSRLTMRKMRENLAWASGYNVIAIPVAAGILIPYGIRLRPELAALIMAASSIIVVTNAMLLRREKL